MKRRKRAGAPVFRPTLPVRYRLLYGYPHRCARFASIQQRFRSPGHQATRRRRWMRYSGCIHTRLRESFRGAYLTLPSLPPRPSDCHLQHSTSPAVMQVP